MSDRWIGLNDLSDEVGMSVRNLQYIRAQEPGVLTTRQRGSLTQYKQPDCAINLRTREADLEKHLTSGQGVEQKDEAREKAREEARKKLEEELKKPLAERRMPEYGSEKDFQLIQAINQLKGLPVMVSKTLVERKEEKKEE